MDGGVQLGKLSPSAYREGALIPYGGVEEVARDYEVLMKPRVFYPFLAGAPADGPKAPDIGQRPDESQGCVPPVFPDGPLRFSTNPLAPALGPPWPGGKFEYHAIACGWESNGDSLFCALAEYRGGLHPGKVRPGFGGASIGWGGKENWVTDGYAVWCDGSYGFEPATEGVPEGGVSCGWDDDQEALFVARNGNPLRPPFQEFWYGSVLGKARPDGWGLTSGAEMVFRLPGGDTDDENQSPYQVLTAPSGQQPIWAQGQYGSIPDGALVLGYDQIGTHLFCARAPFGQGLHPGQIGAGFGGALIPYGGNPNLSLKYEVLVAYLDQDDP